MDERSGARGGLPAPAGDLARPGLRGLRSRVRRRVGDSRHLDRRRLQRALGAIVVAASTAVGVLLVVGYLIVPGAFGRLLASGTRAMAALAALSALVGGWAGFGVALLRAPRPLSPQACVALGVLACFAFACALRQLREVRVGRDEASAGSQGTLTARETGGRVGDNTTSVRETARETWASQLLMVGEAS